MNKNDEKVFSNTEINYYPGHMAKTKRLISENLNLIDVVYEVIDARMPKSSKMKDIDDILKDKKRILIMTKADLCDKEITSNWQKYYESLGYKVVVVDLLNNFKLNLILDEINKVKKTMNEKRTEKGLKERRIRALVVGIPNVGKSTFINRLVGKKATNVGNKPGITKELEWIRINNDLELLDTPGILWPKLDNQEVALNLASMMAIKEEILDKEEVAIYIINKMLSMYPDNIKNRYNITDTSDIVTILDQIGKKIGAIRGGETDYEKVSLTVLKDLNNGYLGKVTFDTEVR